MVSRAGGIADSRLRCWAERRRAARVSGLVRGSEGFRTEGMRPRKWFEKWSLKMEHTNTYRVTTCAGQRENGFVSKLSHKRLK